MRTGEVIGTGDQYLNITPVAQTLRVTIKKDLLKLRSKEANCEAKDVVNKAIWQHTEWEEMFT